MDVSKRIYTGYQLSEDALKGLIDDAFLAVVIKGYISDFASVHLAQGILSRAQLEPYTHEEAVGSTLIQSYYGVDRMGVPFNSTYGHYEDDVVQRYYNSIDSGRATLRSLAAPYPNPIDLLRLDLDEKHAHGATVAAFEGCKMMAGIVRVTQSHLSHLGAAEPHFDALPPRYAQLATQFAANIYLQVPTEGGDLELWDVEPLEPGAQTPRLWRKVLPEPVVIQPQRGDLILFNCRRPHAVRSFEGQPRISAQMFIGQKPNGHLVMWN